jgi:hypothetical protein
LPVPGPPVRTESLCPRALRRAARCSSWNSKPALFWAHSIAASTLIGGQPARDPGKPQHHVGDLALRAVVDRQLDQPGGAAAAPRRRGRGARAALRRRAPRSAPRPGPPTSRASRRVVPEHGLVVGRVPLLLERLHREEDARVQPRGCVVREPEVDRDPVGRLETDPLDLPRHPVGLGGEDRLGLRSVLLDQLDALPGAHPVGLQEDVQLALGALAVPGQLDRGGALAPDPGTLRSFADSSLRTRKVSVPNASTILFA